MKNLKKGFTLLEVVVTLAIITILLTISVGNLDGNSNIINKVKSQYCNNSILNFFQMSREYCKKNNLSAYISVDSSLERFKFMVDSKCKFFYQLPKGFDLDKINTEKGNLKISSNGRINPSGCVFYKDSIGKDYKVIIEVAISKVKIRKVEKKDET